MSAAIEVYETVVLGIVAQLFVWAVDDDIAICGGKNLVGFEGADIDLFFLDVFCCVFIEK